jgi:hypothetical protein
MRGIAKIAFLTAVAGVLMVPAVGPASAHWNRYHHYSYRHHHHHHHFVHRGYGAFAFVRGHRSSSDRYERACMRSPSSLGYLPCMNKE